MIGAGFFFLHTLPAKLTRITYTKMHCAICPEWLACGVGTGSVILWARTGQGREEGRPAWGHPRRKSLGHSQSTGLECRRLSVPSDCSPAADSAVTLDIFKTFKLYRIEGGNYNLDSQCRHLKSTNSLSAQVFQHVPEVGRSAHAPGKVIFRTFPETWKCRGLHCFWELTPQFTLNKCFEN